MCVSEVDNAFGCIMLPRRVLGCRQLGRTCSRSLTFVKLTFGVSIIFKHQESP